MLKGKIFFRDNNGKVAEMTVPFGPGDDIAGALTALLNLAPFLASVSSATITHAAILKEYPGPSTAPPGPNSSVKRATVLFYRNGDDTASILVPSVALVHFEAAGAYSGQRITRDSAALSGVLTSLDNLLTGTLDDVGRPYGDHFLVGGVTRI